MTQVGWVGECLPPLLAGRAFQPFKVGKMKKHLAIVLPLLVVGCTEPEDKDQDGIIDGVREPDSVSVVAPANPKGTVSGQVLNTRMQPLPGASVQLTIGSATTEQPVTATTDASGNFMFKNVPAGSQVLVTIGMEGYATLRASAVVPSSAGNIPINNGNASIGAITLAETKSTVRFTLVTPSGRPAAGAQAYLEASPTGTIAFNGSTVTAVSSVVVLAQADAQGVVSFNNVPAPAELARIGEYSREGGSYRLWVDPVDVNSDGVIDAAGYAKKIDASSLMVYGGSQLILLPAPRNDADSMDPSDPSTGSGFSLVATSLSSLNFDGITDVAKKALAKEPLRNMLRANESLFVAFSHPIQKDTLLATVTDESGRTGAPMTVTPNATGDAFSLALPSPLSIVEGNRYNVVLRATSAYDQTTLIWKGYFISGDVGSPKSTTQPGFVTVAFKDGAGGTTPNLDNGECVVVTFNQVVIPPDATVLPPVEAFFNANLGLTGRMGEYGAATGLQLSVAPAPMVNACFDEKASYPISTNFTFTPRYYLQMNTGVGISVPAGTAVKLAFSKYATSAATYETAWAKPLTSDVEVSLTKL